MSEINEIMAAMQTMEHARVVIEDDRRIIAEMRARIEQQRAVISVALGYLQSGRPIMAAMALSGSALANLDAAKKTETQPSLDFGDALRIARGCLFFGGGHHADGHGAAYHHGIQTVINGLEAAEKRTEKN
jgi:hypothetical protein